MKKLIAVLMLVISLLGCSINNTAEIASDSIAILDNTMGTGLIIYSDNADSESAPQTIYFYSLAEYNDFISAMDMPDDAFIEYLDENNYSMNGVATKEDALLLVEKLNKISIPIIEDVQKISLVIACEAEILTVKQIDSTDNLYSVRISLSPDGKFISDSIRRIHEMNLLHNIEDTQNVLYYTHSNNQHVYEGYIAGNLIDFRGVNTTESDSDEAVASLFFTSLTELCK